MIRLSLLTVLFSLAAVPAFAHEGAGILHFLGEADHVALLIAAIAVPVLFRLVLRGKQPQTQKQKVRKD